MENLKDFSFATFENKPIFIDEYLFEKETKKAIKFQTGASHWYLVDWNENGIFNELGIDYYGVKSPFKSRPILSILKKINILNHNGISYSLTQKSNFKKLEINDSIQESLISYITDFIPIELKGDEEIEKDLLGEYDKTVIYFWASWCRPCVEKLSYLETKKEELKQQNINFIPIYYKCSHNAVMEEIKKRKLSFNPIELSERSALSYQVGAVPEIYVFDRNGKLISETFEFMGK